MDIYYKNNISISKFDFKNNIQILKCKNRPYFTKKSVFLWHRILSICKT